MNRPQEVTLSPPEGEARIEHERWTADNRRVVVQVLRMSFWVLFALQDAKLSLTRLRTLLFGEPTPRRRVPSSHDSSDTASPESSEHGDSASGLATGNVDGPPRPARGHRPGQGRVGAVSNEGAERVACRHEARRVGEVCPVCGQGRLYALPPGVEMRLDGDALLSAIRDEVEKLRCAACGEVFTAALPDGTGAEQQSSRARAVLVLGRYSLGLPLQRLEAYQAMLGVPVPDATQQDQIERVAHCGQRVLAHLERLAAQGELISQDDTSVRILSLIEENRQAQAHTEALGFSRAAERTGMYTTALVVRGGASRRLVSLILGGLMPGKTSKRCWKSAKPTKTHRWACRMPW